MAWGGEFSQAHVTGNKTWVSQGTLEKKRQLMEWKHNSSRSAKKFNVVKSTKQIQRAIQLIVSFGEQ